MKTLLSLLAVLVVINFSYAQNTVWPGPNDNANVGIGTITPAVNLHIWEVSDSRPGGNSAPTKSVFKLSRAGTPGSSYNESAEFRIGHGGPNVWGSQLDLYINSGGNQSNIPDQHAMTWLYSGNVGIGTITPLTKLDVAGALLISGNNANTDPVAYNTNFLANSGKMLIGWNRIAGSGETDFIANQGGGGIGGFAFFNHDNSNNEYQLMRILGNGNVGIGTTNPDQKLTVNGTIHSKEVKVDASIPVPDYVFDSDYKLTSLTEVKDYIAKNHHLPEMPSAAQISKDGLKLGEMNTLLLKKVEELTLHLIEQNKQLQAQQQQLEALTKEVHKN